MKCNYNPENIINCWFPVSGPPIPYYHGYLLFAALSRKFPDLHSADWLEIGPVSGEWFHQDNTDLLRLNNSSKILFRLPATRLIELAGLINSEIVISDNDHSAAITLGDPIVGSIRPADSLVSWFVTLRIHNGVDEDGDHHMLPPSLMNPDNMLAALYRRLHDNEMRGTLVIDRKMRHYAVIKIGVAVGYPVLATDLTEINSIKLQTIGLGGRRHMGCGLFVSPEENYYEPCRYFESYYNNRLSNRKRDLSSGTEHNTRGGAEEADNNGSQRAYRSAD